MSIRPTTTLALAASALLLLAGCGVPGATAGQSADDLADPSLTAWDDLKVGDCILEDDWEAQLGGGGVQVVDCTEEHTDELFAIAIHTDGSFPGEEEILSRADDACRQAFEGYVGTPYEESDYDFSYTAPSEETWTAGDRESLCFLFDLEGDPLTGSAKDAGL
jgi:Septum formation